MKKSKARPEAEAEARAQTWALRWRAARIAAGRPAKSLRDLRRVTPRPPREYSRARMEQWFKQQFFRTPLGKDGDLMHSVDIMRMHFDDIFSIIDETIADDDKAGLLMLTIYYALGTAEGHGRTEGRRELEAREREKASAGLVGTERGVATNQDKAAAWHKEAGPIWWEKRGRFLVEGGRRPKTSQESLAKKLDEDEALRKRVSELPGYEKGVSPKLPGYAQILWTIKNIWEKELRACLKANLPYDHFSRWSA